MNQVEQWAFPIVVYGGSTAAFVSGSENSSACPDSLAAMFRDAVVLYDVPAVERPAEPNEPNMRCSEPGESVAAAIVASRTPGR